MSEIQDQKIAFFSSSGMVKEKEKKVKTMGSSSISGGKIDKFFKSSGSAKIDGNLECNGFKSLGSSRGNGSIISHGPIKSSGAFRIEGGIKSDENVKFSGSANIGEDTELHGKFKAFGSFKTGGSLKTGSNLVIFGATTIGSDIISQGDVKIKGAANVSGNIYAENISLGRKRWWNIFGIRHGRDRPYKVSRTILGNDKVAIRGTVVNEDVKGRRVRIQKYSRIEGQVYYIDSIKVHRKAKLNNEPMQIDEKTIE